jgi:hypothetical protein
MQPTLILVRDLMFSSKISATARAAGITIEMLRDPATLPHRSGQRLIVDLNQPAALQAAIDWKAQQAGRQLIGFVSHVDTELIAHARQAGVDRILSRGQFTASLETVLRE